MEGLDPNVQAALYGAVTVLVVKAIDVALGRHDRARSVRDELRAELRAVKEERDMEVKRRREAEDRELEARERELHALKSLKAVSDERDTAETASRMARAVAEEAVGRMRAALERAESLEREARVRDGQIETLRAQLAKAQRQARLRALGPGDTDPDA